MHALTTLIAREGYFLVLLVMLGSGPAALLSESFDRTTRIALAPILGLCVGFALTTTLVQFAPVDDTAWALVPLALASVALAVHRSRGITLWPVLSLRDTAQLALVVVAVAAPTTGVLAHHHSTGPAVYYYTDVDGYVYQADGMRSTSAHDATHAWKTSGGQRSGDFVASQWDFRAAFNQQFDAVPLESSAAKLAGIGGTDGWAPFLLMILLAGGLGAYAVVRTSFGEATWAAALAGALFGGTFFLRMYFDTYQAAICALALTGPLAIVAGRALTRGHRGDLVAVALLVGGFLNVYPIFVPLVVVATGVVVAWLAVRAKRAGAALRLPALTLGRRILGVGVLAIATQPVAFWRDLDYAKKVVHNEIPLPRTPTVPSWDVVPGWVLQTREYWFMPSLAHASAKQLVVAAAIPALLIAVAIFALVRHRPARALLALAAMAILAAYSSYHSQDQCNYCAERNLLLFAPLGAILLAGGIHLLYRSGVRVLQVAAIAVALVAVVSIGQRTRIELRRFSLQSFFFDDATRKLIDDVPHDGAPVQLEGFWASQGAQAEQALVYAAAREQLPGRVSLSLGSDYNNALQYMNFDQVLAPGPEFHRDYRYVLTRFPTVASARTTIRRFAGVALQRRAAIDVTPVAGVVVPLTRYAQGQGAWLLADQPLVLWVVGAPAGTTYVRLLLRAAPVANASIPPAPGVRSSRSGNVLTVCAKATGSGVVRTATVKAQFAPQYQYQPSATFPPATTPPPLLLPLSGLELTSMRATTGTCSVRGR